ncbi:RNA helicase [Plasmodiophora brassicae]|nr:hypothetical protein PBRA_002135 [Plasmodiophora brassicae]
MVSPDVEDARAAQERVKNGDESQVGMTPLKRQEVKLSDSQLTLRPAERFEDLPLRPELLQGIAKMNWTVPSPIQAKALPHLLVENAQNLIAQAPAGTGKTAAFVLAMLHRIDESVQSPQAIVICPTRELSKQNADVTNALAQFTKISVFTALPDTTIGLQTIKQQVVVGAPGSLMKLIRARVLDLSKVVVCVIDEADEMIKQSESGPPGPSVSGMSVDTSKIVSYLNRASCHIMLFSATFPTKVRDYALKVAAPNPFKITVSVKNLTLPHIKHFEIPCPTPSFKFDIMCALFKIMNVGQSIIFVNTRRNATELYNQLEAAGYKCSLIHGEVSIEERDRVIQTFRALETSVLVTTDLLNRGFDVPEVSCVVNYDIPNIRGQSLAESYYHRTGRAGRFGRPGIAVNLICSAVDEAVFEEIKQTFSVSPIKITATTEQELYEFLLPYVQEAEAELDLAPGGNAPAPTPTS